jgi:hypothetical protein
VKRDDDAVRTPIARNRAAKPDRHAAIEQLASISTFTNRRRDRRAAAFNPVGYSVGYRRSTPKKEHNQPLKITPF